jgi:hypothetical protein
VYDACNRLVRVKRRVDAETVIATYSYQGDTRRCRKVVTNCGIETVPNDGGNTSINFYYGGLAQGGVGRLPARWSIFETRNGSNQTTWQYVWGTQYIDEIVLADRNGDATASNDCNPDVTAQGESSETPADQRYFYLQDRNWNEVRTLSAGGKPTPHAGGTPALPRRGRPWYRTGRGRPGYIGSGRSPAAILRCLQ